MRMIVEAKLNKMCENGVKIGVGIGRENINKNLIPEFYIAMLKGMRDAYEHEFHEAMINFTEEEWIDDESTD